MGQGFFKIMTSGLLDTVFKSIDRVKAEMTSVADRAVKENEHVIVDMNTAQLLKGKDSDGDLLTPEYRSDEYAAMKHGMNPRPPFATPDLFLEGDFQEGFFTRRVKMGWEVDSKDSKRDKLANKYGDSLFGNTKEDELKINKDYILPDLIEYLINHVEL